MHSLRVPFLLLLLPLAWLPCQAAPSEQNAHLERVGAALAPVLEALDPEPEILFSNQGKSLEVRYRTQVYKIHPRSMSGEVSPQVVEVMGPGFKGFVLKVHLQEKGTLNQAVTPQQLREPYWVTHLQVTHLADSNHQIYWALSSGSRTDPKLLTKLRNVLGGLRTPQRTD